MVDEPSKPLHIDIVKAEPLQIELLTAKSYQQAGLWASSLWLCHAATPVKQDETFGSDLILQVGLPWLWLLFLLFSLREGRN